MRVAIGSINPVKIRAVETVLRAVYSDLEIIPSPTRSNVPAQPIGNAETRRGALNRARAALEAEHADWGVGLEGGIIQTEMGTMTTAWCVIVDRAGRIGLGGASSMLLPDSVAQRVLNGMELGEAMDEFAGIENVKHKMGAIGVLTRGLIDRQQAYEVIVKFALARFLWEGQTGDAGTRRHGDAETG